MLTEVNYTAGLLVLLVFRHRIVQKAPKDGSCFSTFAESSFLFDYLFKSQGRKKKTPWSASASELQRPSDRRLSAK
jgi:hypothetical protein